jgi:uncharacterized protein
MWIPRVALALLVFLASDLQAAVPVRDRIFNPPVAPLIAEEIGAQKIAVTTSDGLSLNGLLISPQSKPLLLILHGSGASAGDVGRWLRPLADAGYGLLIAEYRGFSGNPGYPSQAGLREDARAFFQAAKERYPDKQIVVVGHSLGGGVAFDLALVEPIDLLVTIGTFPRITALAPPLARPFIKDRFDNVGKLADLRPQTTFVLMHGTDDDVVPAALGNALHNEAVKLKRSGASFVLTGQNHRPDARLIAEVLDYALAIIAGGRGTLPQGVQVAPFR